MAATTPATCVHPMHRWQEQEGGCAATVEADSRAAARGVADPGTGRAAADVEGGLEQRGMLLDSTTRRPIVVDHEHPEHKIGSPAPLRGDSVREPGLAIEPVQHRLDVRDDRLHLDHGQDTCRSMERQGVDRPALAIDRE